MTFDKNYPDNQLHRKWVEDKGNRVDATALNCSIIIVWVSCANAIVPQDEKYIDAQQKKSLPSGFKAQLFSP